MPFHFTCPYCFKKTLVEDKYAGQTGPCATCGKTVTLPTLKELLPATTRRSSSTLFVASQHLPSVSDLGKDAKAEPLATASERSDAESNQIEPALPNRVLHSPFTESKEAPPVVLAQVASPDQEVTSKRRTRKYWVVGASTIGLIVFGVVAYNVVSVLFSTTFFQELQERRNRAMCMNNLSKIARALDSYAATHGAYPPSVVYDDKGKPKHSWRVLILRELGEHNLYNRYKFDEPWDSENNSMLFAQCPTVFTSPGVGKAHESNYFLVVGANTLFPAGPPLRPQDISDGPGRTILVVEAQNLIHEWTKPIDVIAGGNSPIKMGGNHKGGFTAATADGTPLWIPDDTSPVLINSLITPAGNEPVDPSVFTP